MALHPTHQETAMASTIRSFATGERHGIANRDAQFGMATQGVQSITSTLMSAP